MDAMYRRDVIGNTKFVEGVKSGEDLPFNFALRRKGYKLLYTTHLWVWHYHPESFVQLTKKWRKYGKNYFWPYKENKDFITAGFWFRFAFVPYFVGGILTSAILPEMISGFSLFNSNLAMRITAPFSRDRSL